MIVFCGKKLSGRGELGAELSFPCAGFFNFRHESFGGFLLCITVEENRRSVLGADVIALAVQSGRIVHLEKQIEKRFETHAFWIKFDFDRLRVAGRTRGDVFVTWL